MASAPYAIPTKSPNKANKQELSSSVPLLSREFVVRRISEGESGRLKEELKCEACGKGYKHISSLAKHLWEHTPEWNVTKKLLISKHQQVQLLEAASILVGMNDQPSPLNEKLDENDELKDDGDENENDKVSKAIRGHSSLNDKTMDDNEKIRHEERNRSRSIRFNPKYNDQLDVPQSNGLNKERMNSISNDSVQLPQLNGLKSPKFNPMEIHKEKVEQDEVFGMD
jgi:hypothetical protein